MDLYIRFYDNLSDESIVIREILEYVIQMLEFAYNLTIDYMVERDPASDEPYLVINDFEPIYFDKIPDIDMLVKLLLVASDSKWLNNRKNFFEPEAEIVFP